MSDATIALTEFLAKCGLADYTEQLVKAGWRLRVLQKLPEEKLLGIGKDAGMPVELQDHFATEIQKSSMLDYLPKSPAKLVVSALSQNLSLIHI